MKKSRDTKVNDLNSIQQPQFQGAAVVQLAHYHMVIASGAFRRDAQTATLKTIYCLCAAWHRAGRRGGVTCVHVPKLNQI